MADPPSTALANFERMLAAGRDSGLLRYSLGLEYLKSGDSERAAMHLQHAVTLDPDYTAAWKALGRALTDRGQLAEALAAYRTGIGVAQRKGDKQAGKEMEVFARRIEKTLAAGKD
jgi:Tfp pilus assembly protein PilF